MTETEQALVNLGQLPEIPVADVQKVGMFTGMQLEELGKKVELISHPMGHWLRQYGLMFRGGEINELIRAALADPDTRQKLLLADMAVAWETVGAAGALGANAGEAYDAFVAAQVAETTAPDLSRFLA